MNADDTLYGRIKNGVLTLSGNNSSIRVDGGSLVVSDGPTPVDPTHKGKAPPLEQRMTTLRLPRAGCPVTRIVVTRPDGFITFGAIKWLHGVGASLVQLDWDGTVLLATAPPGTDQPALRRAQALASGNETGVAVMREVLRSKLSGQASVARTLGNPETADLITDLAAALDEANYPIRFRAIEATAATAYWSLWATLPVHFARRDTVPRRWQSFGPRTSPLSEGPRKAATPANAILNYLFGVVMSEITVALAGAGLDPGIGIFHTDKYRRESLAYDAIEVVRPYVESWLLTWLAEARFAKRDFYEEQDGTVRVTRPLTSHLAATLPIWHPAARATAEWLAYLIGKGEGRAPRSRQVMVLPKPQHAWNGSSRPIPRTCHECGKALPARRVKFCSDACAASFQLGVLPAGGGDAALLASDEEGSRFVGNRHRISERCEGDGQNSRGHGSWKLRPEKNPDPAGNATEEKLRRWYADAVMPRLASLDPKAIAEATGITVTWARQMRRGVVPHPRHFVALAQFAGVAVPEGLKISGHLPMSVSSEESRL